MNTAKEEYLKKEADRWFERNKEMMENVEKSEGIRIFNDFLLRGGTNKSLIFQKRVLEIGSSMGYNLAFLEKNYLCKCYGVEPSEAAVSYGKKKYPNIALERGTADTLNYNDSYFDVVILGFCLYQVDRNLLYKVVAEVDRVLKEGGILVITDFDIPGNIRRENIHTSNAPTYKQDYGKLFYLNMGYSLIEKRTYSSSGDDFSSNIQERISTQILYKEYISDIYKEG